MSQDSPASLKRIPGSNLKSKREIKISTNVNTWAIINASNWFVTVLFCFLYDFKD